MLADSVRRAMARPRARAGDSRSRLRRRRRRAGSPSPGATGSGNATDGRAGARPSPLSGRRPGASPPYFRAVTALGRNAVPVAGRRPLYGILSHLLPLALARLLLAGALSHWPASAGAAPMDHPVAPSAPPHWSIWAYSLRELLAAHWGPIGSRANSPRRRPHAGSPRRRGEPRRRDPPHAEVGAQVDVAVGDVPASRMVLAASAGRAREEWAPSSR